MAKNKKAAQAAETQTENGADQANTETQVASTETSGQTQTTETSGETAKKSIVPSKYAGKYKNGGSDALAEFIKSQCNDDKGVLDFGKFFDLCKKNGIDAAKVDGYAQQVADKRHGAQGRARMTLRNMLATIARKNASLTGLDGADHAVVLPKPALTGAAAKAQEAAASETASAQ